MELNEHEVSNLEMEQFGGKGSSLFATSVTLKAMRRHAVDEPFVFGEGAGAIRGRDVRSTLLGRDVGRLGGVRPMSHDEVLWRQSRFV